MAEEQRLKVIGTSGPVPLVVWLPDRSGSAVPLLLAGHGGGGHKADSFVTALRDRLLPRGIAVAAIDAIGHGDRASADPQPDDVIRVISEASSYEQMATDWTVSLDALLETGDFDAGAIAYAGLSGGTLFGLPFIAADERITVGVLGACGVEGAPLLGEAPSTFAPVLRAAARRYRRPALFYLQADDDFFPPDGGRSLFAELASNDKRLIESPGTHTEVPPSALDDAAAWLHTRLWSR